MYVHHALKKALLLSITTAGLIFTGSAIAENTATKSNNVPLDELRQFCRHTPSNSGKYSGAS